MALDSLKEIDVQKEKIARNTQQFVEGKPANNVLLTGARGTGKSSLDPRLPAGLCAAGPAPDRSGQGRNSPTCPTSSKLSSQRPEKFIVFSDDLSFDEGEPGYKALKSILDGSIAASTPNVLIYATSNRRHLLPEYMKENLTYTHTDEGEVHPGEVIEEKISLSERFGLWVSFYPFSQNEYLTIVGSGSRRSAWTRPPSRRCGPRRLVWALERGSRSGRVAYQFARDYAGRSAA